MTLATWKLLLSTPKSRCTRSIRYGIHNFPVHTTESFLKVAETLVEMGTDSLCIKDMSGLLGPADAYDLVSTFKNVLVNCQSICTAISLAVLQALHTGKLLKLA